jgi:hypothetical protein
VIADDGLAERRIVEYDAVAVGLVQRGRRHAGEPGVGTSRVAGRPAGSHAAGRADHGVHRRGVWPGGAEVERHHGRHRKQDRDDPGTGYLHHSPMCSGAAAALRDAT